MLNMKSDEYPSQKDYEQQLLKKNDKIRKKKNRKKQKSGCGATDKANCALISDDDLKNIWEDGYSMFNLLCDKKLSPKQRKDILNLVCKKKHIRGICDVVRDVCYNRKVGFTEDEQKQIHRDRKFIKRLIKKTTPIEEKRLSLSSSRGGSILHLLLPIAAEIAKPFLKVISKL